MDSSARHIRHLEVIFVLDKVYSAERIRCLVEGPEPIWGLDIEIRKIPPAWEAVAVRTVGSDNLASMLCCNAVAVFEAIGSWAQHTRKQVLEDHNEGVVAEIRACCTMYHHKQDVLLGASPYEAGLHIW